MAVFACYCRLFSAAVFIMYSDVHSMFMWFDVKELLSHKLLECISRWSVCYGNGRFYPARSLNAMFMLLFFCTFGPLSVYF